MSEQPEALRLADALTKHLGGNTATQAAAELRRLHEVNQELLGAVKQMMRYMDEDCGDPDCAECKHYRPVWAAIAKAKGEKK